MTPTPGSYDELFEKYWEYVVGLLHKFGFRADLEDVASEILLKFYEKDFLAEFNEGAVFDTPSGRKRSTFQGFLSGFVWKYSLQYRDKQMVKMNKEPIHLEDPVGDSGSLWIDVFAPMRGADIDEDIALVSVLRDAHDYLAGLPIRGTRDLAKLFRLMVNMVMLDGIVDRKVLAAEFGVSQTAIYLMISDLREALDKRGFRTELFGSDEPS